MRFLLAVACGALLGAPIVWACNQATHDASACSSATTCVGTTPVKDTNNQWTCADAKRVFIIVKTCSSTTNNATCDDKLVYCSQSTHCNVLNVVTNVYCINGTGYGSWDTAYQKQTHSGGCY